MNYLVFDFETTGIGKDSANGYGPYPTASQPLPHANYPVQLACELVNNQGSVLKSFQTLLTGAERLDPWVMANCPHLSINDCERDGVELSEAIQRMVDMIGDEPCTLVDAPDDVPTPVHVRLRRHTSVVILGASSFRGHL